MLNKSGEVKYRKSTAEDVCVHFQCSAGVVVSWPTIPGCSDVLLGMTATGYLYHARSNLDHTQRR